MQYRADIDGLRALAVIPVILFHAGFSWMSGGYVGVDVFFVISGFLITQLLLNDLKEDRFSFKRFYERRARRILPALLTVILASSMFSLVLMTPTQLVDFSESIISTLFFYSNFHFYFEEGYFSASSELKPLLHTWSLSIEEQYYLLFPVALLIVHRWLKPLLVPLLVAIALFSLLFAQFSGNLISIPPYIEPDFKWFDQSFLASYYMPFGRIWELMFGAILAFFVHRNGLPVKGGRMFSLVGTLLIVYSAITFDVDTPFPSVFTLVPVVGAGLVLLYSNTNNIIGRLFSSKVLVFIGLISYSLYLWHQPVFAFVRLGDGEVGNIYTLLPLLIIFALSYISYRFVESPFRNKQVVPNKTLCFAVGGLMLLSLSFAGLGISTNGLIQRYPEEDRKLLAINEAELARFTPVAFKKRLELPFPNNDAPKILLIGDSYAMDFLNLGLDAGYFEESAVSTVHIERQCGLVLSDEDLTSFIPQDERAYCERRGRFEKPQIHQLITEADIIVLAARWEQWVVNRLPKTIENLRGMSQAHVIVIGKKYFGRVNLLSFLGASREEKTSYRKQLPEEESQVMKNMANHFTDIPYVDMQNIMCGSYTSCALFTSSGDVISIDGGHLSPMGVDYFSKKVFSHPALQALK